jgi:ABC-type sugar transport system substrate-binding protein
VVLAVLVALGLIASACVNNSGKPAGASGSSGPKKIDFIFTGYTPPYFAPMAKGVKDAASHYSNFDVNVLSANGDASTEISDIKEAVSQGIDGIILNTIDASVSPAAQQAMSQGVPVVTIDRDVNDPKGRVAFIGAKDTVLGQKQTQYALNYLSQHHVKQPWNVVILQGTQGSSTAIDREKGAMSVLKPYVDKGQVKVVLNQSADFDTAAAQQLMSTELSKTTDIQLIVAGNDAMALGAINALKSHNLTPGKDVLVVGADAQPESLDAIKQGTQLDTVTHSPYVEAFWAVEAMANYLDNHTKPSSQFPAGAVTIPMVVVTGDNIGSVSAWGTPSKIPPLPYGTASSYPAGG